MKTKQILLEACVASVADAVLAVSHGAERLELNVGIELGGITPSLGLLQQTKEAVDAPVMVIIRPRGGGFCYSASERRLMVHDAQALLAAGADGVVTGGLGSQGRVDASLMEQMRDVCQEKELVFHMAFDLLNDPEQGLEELVSLQVSRVLTAGGRSTAIEGKGLIAKLVAQSAGRIDILPGGGVDSGNVIELLRHTGCSQVHGTFKMFREDAAKFVCDGRYPALDELEIRRVRSKLNEYVAKLDQSSGL